MKMKKLVSALSALAMTVTAMAGLAVTANAAAGDVTTNASADFSQAIVDNKTGDFVISSSNSGSPLDISEDGWLQVGKGSGYVEVPDDQLAGSMDKVTVSFKVAYGKLVNRSFYYEIADNNGTKIVEWEYITYSDAIERNVLGAGNDLPSSDEFYHDYNTPIKDRAAS